MSKCIICLKLIDSLRANLCSPECSDIYKKARWKAYHKTDKYKAYKKAYQKTDKYKAYCKAYYNRKKTGG